MVSNKERIKETLFREALCRGRVRACEVCNDYYLDEHMKARGSSLLCPCCSSSR